MVICVYIYIYIYRDIDDVNKQFVVLLLHDQAKGGALCSNGGPHPGGP